jgi:hypothetical protein
VIRRSYLLAGALVAGLAAPTAVRFAVVPAVLLVAPALVWPRAFLVVSLALTGWWWGSLRLASLDLSILAVQIGTAGSALVDLTEPPRRQPLRHASPGVVALRGAPCTRAGAQAAVHARHCHRGSQVRVWDRARARRL